MKKYRNSIFYISIIGIFSALIYWIVLEGKELEQGRRIVQKVSDKGIWVDFVDSIHHNLTHPLSILLAQVVIIIFVSRIFSWISRKIGQPSVIGEIVAGICLGPSLLGYYLPGISAAIFPESSLSNLTFLSQVGLILFMFVIGMELDLKVLKNKAHEAVVISHASIVIPFSLGVAFAYFIYESFAPSGVQFLSFGLFMGIAMSITAFPVLARIVQERGIHKTRLGAMVITCAAADDITAWCILAAVIAIVQAGSFGSSLLVIALAATYVFAMIKIVRPFLRRVGELHTSPDKLSKPIVAIFIVTLLLSSFATEVIGIHALFGAFMAGAIMPDNAKFRRLFIEKMEDISLVLLLPIFFVFTGLRTQIGLLNDPSAWKVAGFVILVAVTGKFLGSAVAARFVGQSWKDSLTIGALMNTRGLMELVVLNIGYDLGILTPEIFAMMVIMALVTTFMTGPILDIINRSFKKEVHATAVMPSPRDTFKILISFTTPETGRTLLKLGSTLARKSNYKTSLTAMALNSANQLYPFNIENYEKESLAPVLEESNRLNLELTSIFKISANIGNDIVEEANKGDYKILLTGMGLSIFEGSLLGKMLGLTTRIIDPVKLLSTVTGKERFFDKYFFDEQTKHIINHTKIPVGILIDKRLNSTNHILILLFGKADAYLLNYADMLANDGQQLTVYDPEKLTFDSQLKDKLSNIQENTHVKYEQAIETQHLQQYDLIIISLSSWKKMIERRMSWLSHIPSALVITNVKSERDPSLRSG